MVKRELKEQERDEGKNIIIKGTRFKETKGKKRISKKGIYSTGQNNLASAGGEEAKRRLKQ